MRIRTVLLATVSSIAVGGGAYAADLLPAKAPAPVAPIAYNWTGFYVGGLVGAARLNSSCSGTFASSGSGSFCGGQQGIGTNNTTSATGAVAGVDVGYDWQSRNFVYGVAADWTWTGLSHTTGLNANGSVGTFQAKVDWLASFRGRMGLAVDDTLVYFTGGLALGQVKDNVNLCNSFEAGCGNPNYGSINTTKVGWVAGMGLEHVLSGTHWSFKGEVLYYDLGRSSTTVSPTCPSGGCSATYSSEFNHEVIVGRVGLAYRF